MISDFLFSFLFLTPSFQFRVEEMNKKILFAHSNDYELTTTLSFINIYRDTKPGTKRNGKVHLCFLVAYVCQSVMSVESISPKGK